MVQVLPSEQPVVNPMTSRQRHRQLLRQRNLERQRLLEQRRRQQQQQQQQGGAASPDQQQPSGQRRTSGQQRPSIKLSGVDEGGFVTGCMGMTSSPLGLIIVQTGSLRTPYACPSVCYCCLSSAILCPSLCSPLSLCLVSLSLSLRLCFPLWSLLNRHIILR